MIKAHMFSRWALAVAMAALFAGCTAPPKKPPPPKPVASQSAPHARGAEGQSGAMQGGAQAAGEGGPGAPGSGQGYGAASANAAEVEEEEVAADGSSRVISSTAHATPPGAQTAAAASAANGAGGGAMPPGSGNAQRAQSPVSGGGGHRPDAQKVGTRYEDMVGIDLEQPEGSQGAANSADADAEAARSGNSAGRINGRGQRAEDRPSKAEQDSDATRLGVRGGADQSGAISGTPSPSSMPPRQREQAPVRENDILAQQLRESAEREKDPALREKLWAEYRKYKAGL